MTVSEIKNTKGYNEVQAAVGGEFATLPAGAYVCEIKKAEDTKSKSGGDMIELTIDICEGEYKDFFMKKWQNDTRTEKKWGAIIKQTVYDNNSVSKFMKGLLKSIEDSNARVPDNTTDWRGLRLGVLFRREEYEKDVAGNTGWITKPFAYLSVESARVYTGAPKEKPLSSSPVNNAYTPTAYQPASVPAAPMETYHPDDELPF